jgi:L-rhamnose mutarotase
MHPRSSALLFYVFGGDPMQRIVYMARLKPDKIEAYKRAHQHVPVELIEEASQCGIVNHSCFLRGTNLIIYLETENYDRTREALVNKVITQKWDAEMADYFDPAFPAEDGSPWEEVFHMD